MTNKKELVKMRNRRYYEKNKEIILLKSREEIRCPICQKIIRKQNMKRHKETIKCSNYFEQQSIITK